MDFSFWVNVFLGMLYACLCLYRYKHAYLLWRLGWPHDAMRGWPYVIVGWPACQCPATSGGVLRIIPVGRIQSLLCLIVIVCSFTCCWINMVKKIRWIIECFPFDYLFCYSLDYVKSKLSHRICLHLQLLFFLNLLYVWLFGYFHNVMCALRPTYIYAYKSFSKTELD